MEVEQALEEIKNIASKLYSYNELDIESKEALSKASYALARAYNDSSIREKSKETINTLKAMKGIIEWDCPLDYSAALDDAIEAIQFVDIIASLGCCNDCSNKGCGWKPLWGESQRYNCPYYIDKIKVGDIITDRQCNYLVTSISDESYSAIRGSDFEPIRIGKDNIENFKKLNDSIDINLLIKHLEEK